MAEQDSGLLDRVDALELLSVFFHSPAACSGARQLFVGDAETGRTAFQPLYSFMAENVSRMGWGGDQAAGSSMQAGGQFRCGHSCRPPASAGSLACALLTCLLSPDSSSSMCPALQVVLSADQRRLDALPPPGRDSIMALVAAFLPYYCNREVISTTPHGVLRA